MNILAIDDLQDNLVTLGALLRRFLPDASLDTARNGLEGIEAARGRAYDAILLDIHMPGLDGYETTKVLKSDPRTRHVPIILLTAQKDDSDSKVRGLEAGADAFLPKPIDEAELIAQIRAMVRIKFSEDALRRERDSLERQVAERVRELKEKQRQNLLLLDAIPHVAMLINSDRRVVALNRSAEQSGLAVGEHCWQGCFRLDDDFPGGNSLQKGPCGNCLAEEALSRNSPLHVDVELASGFWSLWWTPVGQEHFLHYAMDISERVRIEQEKKSLEAQLAQAQKMEALGTLSGGIAHDFNNILGAIMGYTELTLYRTAPDSENREDLTEVLVAARRAKELVKQILAFSRKSESRREPVQFNLILGEAINLLRQTIPTTIEIKKDISLSGEMVYADPTQLHQVVMNLGTNAFHAMRATGGTLQVRLSPISVDYMAASRVPDLAEGDYLLLTVADTGVGIDPLVLPRIFDPFFTTKGKGEGTGMGLSVVHGIIKSHDGAITVRSRLGEGTTFEVYLPLYKGAAALKKEEGAIESWAGGRAMVVDDEPSLARVSAKMLEKLGFTVDTFTVSEEALNRFSGEPHLYDLVLTDMTMPGLTGGEFARRLLERRPELPVIICTGYSENINDETARKLGVKALLTKPLDIHLLSRTVRLALG